MIRPVALFIGLRYTRARRRNHFVSFISGVSILGITIGVWALITVLSVMNGFERELRERILSVASHATVSARNGWLKGWPELAQAVSRHPEVLASAPFIYGQGLLTRANTVSGVLVRGILPEEEVKVSGILNNLIVGESASLREGEWKIVIGAQLAWSLGVSVGDRVTLIAPKGKISPAGLLPRMRRFEVSGVFEMDMYEYDSGIALIHLADAARLLETDGGVTGLRLSLEEIYRAPLVSQQLRQQLGGGFRFSDWTREHANFFTALKIERRVMFVILLLIIAVAAFNIVSTLVMVVTDKRADVAILRTLGLRPVQVMAVFIVQGVVIGFGGTLVGGVLGVLTALNVETLVPWVENLFGIEFFPASVYVISDFPAQLKWPDVYLISGVSFLICLVATVYPAWRASRTQPAEALRYE
ncbi:MAG TPA: lipoprotein-releasing ABC transporter permease subunit [Gammaproteobacteria bacterium]|jgi:lipoprotein-releasing system permease protein|nr:lipoprotein-releasing ABC transporter permease subunit [Gammaproteobacteria bacterium]HBP84296.1 lipoprotein-releasing ABC transporter permease subunit [Gammaproteobacteria bacterium]|tara:strand:+ start:5282 stop:6529 length:1248 start_codon:yes stop_codon:yes gene_type:complete